jgi:hypothetical protein
MRRFIVIAMMFIIAGSGCSRLSVDDLAGTAWESRKVDYDHQFGSTELVLRLGFHNAKIFSLKRTERWVRKKAGVNTPLPDDSEVSGEYRVEGDKIRLMWSDGSSLSFTFRDDKIYSHDETRVFQKAAR